MICEDEMDDETSHVSILEDAPGGAKHICEPCVRGIVAKAREEGIAV